MAIIAIILSLLLIYQMIGTIINKCPPLSILFGIEIILFACLVVGWWFK